jgi:hypothetical protein
MAWAQIEWRTTRSGELQYRRQGQHANISFAGPAAELVCEVIPLCRILTLESNANNLCCASATRTVNLVREVPRDVIPFS